MPDPRRTIIPILLIALDVVAALIGLLVPGIYREPATNLVGLSQATFLANDLVTLFVAVPCMTAAWWVSRRGGSPRAYALWLGGLHYTAYNQSFYLFGAQLNWLFPIYLAAFTLGLHTLAVELHDLDIATIRHGLQVPQAIRRACAVHAWMVPTGLLAVWSTLVLQELRAPRFDPETSGFIRMVAALDIALLLPGFLFAASRLWKNDARGVVVAILLNTGFGIYMLLLAAACIAQAHAGLTAAMKDFAGWAMLATLSFSSLAALLLGARRQQGAGEATRTGEPEAQRIAVLFEEDRAGQGRDPVGSPQATARAIPRTAAPTATLRIRKLVAFGDLGL